MSSSITTHVLDTSRGRPAAGVAIVLEIREPDRSFRALGRGATDTDGRLRTLLPDGHVLVPGTYRLTLDTGSYCAALGLECFYPEVAVAFDVRDPSQHYHVPLLLSPFGYATYRGS